MTAPDRLTLEVYAEGGVWTAWVRFGDKALWFADLATDTHSLEAAAAIYLGAATGHETMIGQPIG